MCLVAIGVIPITPSEHLRRSLRLVHLSKAPVWVNSVHAGKVDSSLNKRMLVNFYRKQQVSTN